MSSAREHDLWASDVGRGARCSGFVERAGGACLALISGCVHVICLMSSFTCLQRCNFNVDTISASQPCLHLHGTAFACTV